MRVWSPVRIALMLEKRRSLASSMVFIRRGETGRAEGGTAGHGASSSPSIPLRRGINSTVSASRVSFTVSPSVSCRGACLSCREGWSPRLAESWVDRELVLFVLSFFLVYGHHNLVYESEFTVHIFIFVFLCLMSKMVLFTYFPLRYFTVLIYFTGIRSLVSLISL